MDHLNNSSDSYEDDYPYVTPDHCILDLCENTHLLEGLSALETAFVKWFMQLSVSEESFRRIKHPAFPFPNEKLTARSVFNRPKVKEAIKRIRKACPFLQVYNSDYLISILHEEVEHLRVSNRHQRFENIDPIKFSGKKSIHEEEMMEAKLLVDCVKQIQEIINVKSGGDKDGNSSSTSDENSSANRVIGEIERIIEASQAGIREET